MIDNSSNLDPAERVKELESLVQVLSEELEETNRGVVALYAEVEDKAQQLKEVSELKSRFLSYMSHEFKTPLVSISSIVRILLDEMDGPLNSEQKKQATFIQTSANELAEMVNDLLDLAKIEAGRITVSPGWFEMVDLFSALRGMFRPLLMASSVNLIFEEPPNIPAIYTDDKKLSQILRNFISNAIKFTPEGYIRVSAIQDGEMVVFSVADTGIGIAPEYVSSIFQDFVQVDSSLQSRFRGTGLGLAVSKKIAELLGGSVSLQSNFGEGSVFSVRIPMRYSPTDRELSELKEIRG